MLTIFEFFSTLSLTIAAIHAGISIWIGYKKAKEQALGPKLQISCKRTLTNIPYHLNEKITFKINLTTYNPTKQEIKINNIWLDSQSPFQFVKAFYPNPNSRVTKEPGINIPVKPKHINLIHPEFKSEPECIFDLFNVESEEQLTISLTIQAMQSEIVNPINIILEHTSSNYPYKTLKIFHCIGFFRFSERQRLNFWAKFNDEPANI
ncbi:hypothetical protein [Bartonella bilalgolemii]|uniref:Uncharacterized protein n=1 Tax=Bartonella bilalgolemii TaxID=2942911 RepID=A0ABT0PB98_9HYPH|nr:hypothetical protein [Bartonella sp. G70]MCL6230367.1 hypothetical protein [Bartonella sp. G70]